MRNAKVEKRISNQYCIANYFPFLENAEEIMYPHICKT